MEPKAEVKKGRELCTDPNLSDGWTRDPSDQLQERRLAGAIGTNDSKAAPTRDLEVQVF